MPLSEHILFVSIVPHAHVTLDLEMRRVFAVVHPPIQPPAPSPILPWWAVITCDHKNDRPFRTSHLALHANTTIAHATPNRSLPSTIGSRRRQPGLKTRLLTRAYTTRPSGDTFIPCPQPDGQREVPVLIVGGGPVGTYMSLLLSRLGVARYSFTLSMLPIIVLIPYPFLYLVNASCAILCNFVTFRQLYHHHLIVTRTSNLAIIYSRIYMISEWHGTEPSYTR